MIVFRFVLLIEIIFCLGCASTTTRDKIYRDMAVGFAAGAVLGQLKSDNQLFYSEFYGAAGSSIAAVYSVYENTQDNEKLKAENNNLQSRLDEFQKKLQPELIQSGKGLFSSPVPKEVSKLVEPGEWKLYKMDQWVEDPNQPNTWYHQKEMFEIVPPTTR